MRNHNCNTSTGSRAYIDGNSARVVTKIFTCKRLTNHSKTKFWQEELPCIVTTPPQVSVEDTLLIIGARNMLSTNYQD